MTDQMLVEPVELSDAEVDLVAGGQISADNLISVNVSNIDVAVPVNANVAASVLGGPTGIAANQPGRIFQA